jgi:hypothetical protein
MTPLPQKFTPRELPKLAELHQSPEEAFKNDELNRLLSSPVHHSWIKQHPIVKVKNEFGQMAPLQYLPIDKVEFLLTKIFQRWRREIISVQVMFHSVAVVVRLHVLNPVTGEWDFNDGGGAVAVQTDKDASAADLSKIKANAVQIALPAAISYALKDAAECFGSIFGKDLNKHGLIEFEGSYSPQPQEPSPVQQAMQIQASAPQMPSNFPAQTPPPQVQYAPAPPVYDAPPPQRYPQPQYAPVTQQNIKEQNQQWQQQQAPAPVHPSFAPPPQQNAPVQQPKQPYEL